jgi:cobalt-zinc-cadmium efflux system protein
MASHHHHRHHHHHGNSLHDDHGHHGHHHKEVHRDHGHHAHGPGPGHRAFAWSITLNLVLVTGQFVFGLMADSLALIADAGHNLADVLGLFIAWFALVATRRVPTIRLSYGLGATSIWAALINAALILVACGAIAWEAVHRFSAPREVDGQIVIWVALAGVVINGLSAVLFHRSAAHDLNARGAYLHLISDAAVSLGVVMGGLAIVLTGWSWIDPAISVMVVAVIVFATWRLFRESLNLALGGVPLGIDPEQVRTFLRSHAGVTALHDLHVWAMSTTEVALTAHLVMPTGHPGDEFLRQLCESLESRFGIHHSTIQIEHGSIECRLAPDHVI